MIRWHDHFNSGDIAFVFLAIAVQILFTWPALGLFYHGMAGRHDLLKLVAKLVPLMSVMTLSWCLWGFSLAFAPGPGTIPFSDPNVPAPALTLQEMMELEDIHKDESINHGRGGFFGGNDFLNFQGHTPVAGAQRPSFPSRRPFYRIPHLLFLTFHMLLFVAAPIPLLLLFEQRVRPVGILLFAVIWGTLVYSPVAHWVWGDGWLESLGVIDTGGGLIQVAIGFSALAYAVVARINLFKGTNLFEGTLEEEPLVEHNFQQTAIFSLGTLAYWAGTSIVNSALIMHADGQAVMAFVNSHLAASAGAISGFMASLLIRGRTDHSAACTGAIAGLIAVASGCGAMLPQTSLITGGTAALFCCVVVELLHVQRKGQEPLFVFVLQGLAGAVGCVFASIFATSGVAGFRWDGRVIEGAIEGNIVQIEIQLLGVAAAAIWGFVGTLIILFAISFLFGAKTVDSKDVDIAAS